MKTFLRTAGWAGLLLVVGLLTGCATSTVESRKQQRYAAYSALPTDTRALVDQGKITIGMNTDAVFVAWGAPGDVSEGETETGKTATWTYYGTYLQDVQTVGWRRAYTTSYVMSYVRASVVFVNGAVKEWHTFAAPGF